MTGTLETVLTEAQRIGMLGSRPVAEVIEHARAFVRALPDSAIRVLDVGSGAGLPGLVLAVERPNLQVTMVDRRQKRTDFAQRAVRSLGLVDRCQVWWCDVTEVMRRRRAGEPGYEPWDAVVSRGFGPPDQTVAWARCLVRSDGVIVISEPPPGSGDRWTPERLARWGVVRRVDAPHGVAVLSPVVGG